MTNNEQLRQIYKDHHLKYDQIADIIGVSWYTVRSWLVHSGSATYRGISDRNLNKLKDKLIK